MNTQDPDPRVNEPHDEGRAVGLLEELEAEVDAMSDDVLDKSTIDLVRSISVAQTRLVIHVREAEVRNLPQSRYGLGTTGWLRHVTAMTSAEASGTVKTARALAHMTTVADKALAGELPYRTVQLLAQARDRHSAEFADHESVFADIGTYLSVSDMRRAIGHWEQQIDYHDAIHNVHKRDQLRGLHHNQTIDGLWATTATFTPEGGHVVKQAIDGICDPQNLDPGELRSPAQRRADAMVDICSFWLDHSTDVVTSGGEKPHVTVTIDYETLSGQVRRLPEIDGSSVTPATIRRITCDAAIIPMVLGSQGEPLDVGRRTRTIPPALRRAIEHRDRLCTWSGCTAPPSWCDIHHDTHWADGGETSLRNCRLLCRRHHTATHTISDRPPPDT